MGDLASTPTNPHRNHAMLLTPPGPAAIAVLRLAGPDIHRFLSKYFSAPIRENRCIHGNLIDQGRVIDDIVLVSRGDMADLNLHAGPWVVQSALDLARREGFEPSTDPLDAADGQTMFEREIFAWLPLARTELGLRTLLAQKQAWSTLPNRDLPSLAHDLALRHLLIAPKVAIIGLPNAGKSTLANQLFAQERSITADLPGTTRDWVGELANIDGLPVMLIDTPGLRDTPDPIERQAILHSRPQIESADLVLLLLDPTQPAAAQQQLLREYPAALPILNKSDQLSGSFDAGGSDPLSISALTSKNLDILRQRILRHFRCDNLDPYLPRLWTTRHFALARRLTTTHQLAGEILT